jgi:hypothetical protein
MLPSGEEKFDFEISENSKYFFCNPNVEPPSYLIETNESLSLRFGSTFIVVGTHICSKGPTSLIFIQEADKLTKFVFFQTYHPNYRRLYLACVVKSLILIKIYT